MTEKSFRKKSPRPSYPRRPDSLKNNDLLSGGTSIKNDDHHSDGASIKNGDHHSDGTFDSDRGKSGRVKIKTESEYSKRRAEYGGSGEKREGFRSKYDRVRQRNRRLFLVCAALFVLILLTIGTWIRTARIRREEQLRLAYQQAADSGPEEWMAQGAPYIDVQLLTPNAYSRPQIAMESINYIAIHYTANPGATAQENRDYFENLAQTHETKVSSHFVVGLDGEVIQCIPTAEMSYATNSRNVDTISIECCHPDESGLFNDATYDSVVKLAAWLCIRFGLTQEEVIRHYDVTGKECPKYYVDHPEAWQQMKADIAARMEEL